MALATVVGAALIAGCGTVDAAGNSGAQSTAAKSADSSTDSSQATQTAAQGDAASVTAAAAPNGGDVNDVVDVEQQRELGEVKLTEEVTVSKEVTVEILDVAPVKVTAESPGEIGGPAVRVKVVVTNVTDDLVGLDGVTVTGADKAAAPLSPLFVEPAEPLSGELEPGEKAEGTYLFSFPEESSVPITITVNPSPELPIAVFVGSF